MLKYFQDIGLDIPSSPTAALQAFPLVDIAMTLLMIPPNLAIQLGSKITIVKLVGAIRICKVISVCFPIGIDVFLQCMEWKYAGPPSKCCAKCFPCCGKGDVPKKDRVEMKDIKIECVSATEDCGFESTRSLQKGLDEDAATIENRTSALADESKLGEVAGIDADIDALETELQKLAGYQLVERSSSAELRNLQDMAPGDSMEALALAEEVATLGSEMADLKAESEEKKAEEQKKAEEKTAEEKTAMEKTAEKKA